MLGLLLLVLAQAPSARVTLVFGGDVIPHGAVKQGATRRAPADSSGDGWDQVFGPLAPVFRRGDLAVVNLESPVLSGEPGRTGSMRFSAPPTLLAGLQRAGVTVASFANNHALDQGREGIISTRASIHAAGLLGVGADVTEAAAWRPLVVERRGLTIGLLAVTRWLNGFQNSREPGEAHVPAIAYPAESLVGARSVEQVQALVRAEAAKVDALIVFVHWGLEYHPRPSAFDRALGRALLEAGALAVVGHHPHVLQPVEWMERGDGTKGLVAFSLGNLVSNQDAADPRGPGRDGLLLELVVGRDGPGPVRVLEVHGVPVGTEHRRSRGGARTVQPVLLEDELQAMLDRVEELGARADAVSRRERAALRGKLAVARERLERIRAVVGPAVVGSATRSGVPGVTQAP